jgi:hypothetical protein
MMNRAMLQVGTAVGALALFGVSGCRNKTPEAGDVASVRLINAVPDAGGLDVSVNGRRVWKRAAFRSSTGYQAVASGTYPVTLDADGPGTTLLTQSLSFDKNKNYTLLALGQADGRNNAQMQVWPDETPKLPPEKAGVRLVNASPGTPSVDLVVNTIVAVKSVEYGRRSGPLALDGGEYDLQLAASGTATMLTGSVHLALFPGHAYTLVAMGTPGSRQTLTLEAYPDK